MTRNTLLPPTVELVRRYSTQFSSTPSTGQTDLGLRKLIKAFPFNIELSDVLLKVAALNALYATNIYAIFSVAQHILNLQIDGRLAGKDFTLVHDIACIEIRGKRRINYSFASKYCAWHVPEAYAIYDSYVDGLLWRYQLEEPFYQDGFKQSDLRDYPKFMSIVLAFKDYFGLEEMTLREVDRFLWLNGRGVDPSVITEGTIDYSSGSSGDTSVAMV